MGVGEDETLVMHCSNYYCNWFDIEQQNGIVNTGQNTLEGMNKEVFITYRKMQFLHLI
jgi:hypothetical protein